MPVDTSPCDLDALALSRAIHDRALSCRELMQATLARIAQRNPAVNAIVSLQPEDRLLAEADAADAALVAGRSRGWLHGIPQAPKDLAASAGIPTTMGSPLLRGQVPTHDAIVVARARAAGAILVGKTNTPEFGLGSHTYNTVFGTTGNAYDPTRSAGGSSGGAAVALALRMLAVADGSDMMGSLRNPAAWNQVYGLRPSLGRVPYGPAPDAFYAQLGTEGPMARTVADLAALLVTQSGADPRAPLSLGEAPAALAPPFDADVRGRRIGWLGDLDGALATEPGVMAACEAALRTFESLGCTVEPVRPDFAPERVWAAWCTLRGFHVAGSLGAIHARPAARAQLKPEAVWEVEQGLALSAMDVHRASVERTAWLNALLALFERVDVLVLPAAQCFPFDARLTWPREVGGRAMDTYHRWMEVVIGPSLAGLPVLAVPAGFGVDAIGREGPVGLQCVGRPRGERALLELGTAWEAAIAPRLRPPPGVDA